MNPVDGSPSDHVMYADLLRALQEARFRQEDRNEQLRHRQSLLEERVASIERRLAKLRNV